MINERHEVEQVLGWNKSWAGIAMLEIRYKMGPSQSFCSQEGQRSW